MPIGSSNGSAEQSSQGKNLGSEPLVSVVTPFYNTRAFLAECIESVLRQSYQNWEYVLVDNCSTDGSSEVAQEFASRYPEKIRLLQTKSFLTQVQNYNFAISCIAPDSKYCKMVQADDWIFPDCVRSMVEVAETHPAVGIVAAYELQGDCVSLDGLPYPGAEVPGRDACRLYFLKDKYLFGTPTSLLIRSEVIRSRVPFYEEHYAPFEDAHACFDLLRTWNFGFVHQVLTYSRRDNESVLSRIRPIGGLLLARFSAVVAHGREFLSEEEYDSCLKDVKRQYFVFLGASKLRGRSEEFWEFHRKGLAAVNYSLDWRLLLKWSLLALLGYIGNPKSTCESLWALRGGVPAAGSPHD
jgi:glycosyltransferase involved in cell wall biosynthesis